MAKVFISYSRKDIDFAKRLTAELQNSELDFWIDWEGIPPTVDWWKEIEKGIEEADVFLFLISPDSTKSKICGQEIDTAVKNGKRIIPVVVREIEWEDTPPQLGHLNYIFFSRDDDFDTAVKKLMTAIETDYEWAATHRRLQVKALEWERKNKENSLLLRGKDLQEAELQLATNSSKEPHPTDLQRELVFASRKDAIRRQRQTTAGVTTALVISILLGLVAIFQRQEAVKQAKISRAGDLAGQATILRDTELTLSLLLGVEAYNLQDNYRTRVSLLDNINVQPKMIKALVNHSSLVKDVAFSTDGNLLATSSCSNYDVVKDDCSQGEFILWDMITAQPSPRLFKGHSGWIYAVAFNPDSGKKMLVTAGGDNTIIFWNVETGNQISQTPVVHSNSVLNLAFSPNGKYLVSGDGNGLIILWDLQGQTHKELFKGEGPIRTMAFSPDGQVIAFGNCSNFDNSQIVKCEHPTINLLSLETGKFIGEPLQGHHDLIETMAFSPSGKILASGSDDNTVMLWNVEDLKKIQQMGEPLTAHLDWVYSVAFINDDLLASGGVDGTIALWNTVTLKKVDVLTGHADWVNRLAINPDKTILASASDDKTIMLWDIQGNRKPFGEPLAVPNNYPFTIAFDPDSGILATGNANQDGGVLFWDSDNRSQIPGVINTSSGTTVLAYSLDGKRFAAGGFDGSVMYWNLDTLPPTPQREPLIGHSSPILSLSFSHDGRLLASTSIDGVGNVWDLNTNPKEIIKTFSLLSRYGEPNVLIFSPTDNNLIAYGSEQNLVMHNINTDEEDIYPGLLDTVTYVAFSPDGKTVAASSYGNIMLWDLSTDEKKGVPLISQTGNIGEMWRLAFSPDGKTIASSGCGKADSASNCIENQIYLWDVESTQLIGSIATGESTPSPISPFALSFSPDGNYLVSAGCTKWSEEGCTKGQVYLWIFAPKLWVENSCQRAGRNFTRAEWEKYGFTETYRETCDQWPLDPAETAISTP